MKPRCDILILKKIGEYWHIQVAINGVVSVPWDLHEADRIARNWHKDEGAFMAYLSRFGQELISKFGDGRHPYQFVEDEAAA